MINNFRIIQCSEVRTGSTLLTNILYGFFIPAMPVCYCFDVDAIKNKINDNIIIKTHTEQVFKLLEIKEYDIYFISSIRREKNKVRFLDLRKKIPDMIFIDYELINTSIEESVNNVYKSIEKIPISKLASKENAVKRIKNMNKKYEEIKYESFDFVDDFFHIHGHHRNRGE